MSNTVVNGSFEWDADKAASNVAKHGVTFEEAATVVDSDTAIELQDTVNPARVAIIGFSIAARILFVVVVERGARTRIISARKATSHEAKRLGK